MRAITLPTRFFFGAAPAAPSPTPSEPIAPAPTPTGPDKPRKGGIWLLLAGLILGGGAWLAVERQSASGPASPIFSAQTAKVDFRPLETTIRVGGTIQARNYASIIAPRMRGPRDAGRSTLTLMELAEPGSTVEPGGVVARFELKWLEDHIDDKKSAMTQSLAKVEKRRADIMIVRETDRQTAVTAKAEYGKAQLDLRTAEVRSEIEGEILANLAEEFQAAWKQLEYANELKETAHAADLATFKIQVAEDRLHLERHERDFVKMAVTTPIGGLVVMETTYKGGGQFGQSEEGDQVYPGSLFMRVVDVSEMIVAAEINQVDIQAVHMGQRAAVRLDAYPDLELEGRIVAIGAIASRGSSGGGRYSRGSSGLFLKNIAVEIAIDATDPRVIPDLSASADIILGEAPEGLVVPREAVRAGEEGTFVYVRQGDRFVTRSVELGSRNDTHTIVESGLKTGEEVLLGDRPPPAA